MSKLLQVAGLATTALGLGIVQLWAGIVFAGVSVTVLGVAAELEEAKRVSKLP